MPRPKKNPTGDSRRPQATGPVDAQPSEAQETLETRRASLWDTVARLTETDWSHHVIYLYRLLPKVDSGSDRNFIAKYDRAIDEADVLADHGSGKYLAICNDTRERVTVAKQTFMVYNEQAPPRVRPSQIIPCPENEPWLEWVR